MVQVLRKPQESSLSQVRWQFVNELWFHHEAAGRPKLESIMRGIDVFNEKNPTNGGGTASTETIRKMLKGTTVPVNWARVRATLYVLCEMAGTDPKEYPEGGGGYDPPTHEENLRHLWSRALDDPQRGKPAPPSPPRERPRGGWGAGDSDEPPF